MIDEKDFYCKALAGEHRIANYAEQVGFYFGLQRAGNMFPRFQYGEEGNRTLNVLRTMIDAEMKRIVAELPPGTIENW